MSQLTLLIEEIPKIQKLTFSSLLKILLKMLKHNLKKSESLDWIIIKEFVS